MDEQKLQRLRDALRESLLEDHALPGGGVHLSFKYPVPAITAFTSGYRMHLILFPSTLVTQS